MKEKLWGGRFDKDLDPLVFDFTKSIEDDWFLFEYEAYANIAWIKELSLLKIVTISESKKLIKAINEILQDYSKGRIKIDFDVEDIHSLFYELLRRKVSDLTDKIHTGKSRNEQIVTLVRMFLTDAVVETNELIVNLQRAILQRAELYSDAIMPGFTHLQYAQALSFSHWILAFMEQFERDKQRFRDSLKRINVLPLGSGALAGTNFKINREEIRKELGFAALGKNSVDMVSDRDFILEYLNCNVILLLHLSRLSEDLLIYNSPAYGFVNFSDKVTTGSSLMPQKKNADPLELVRASSAQALSSYVFLADVLKGLPTSYDRDLQLDKKALFSSYLTATEVLRVMEVVISQMSLDKKRLAELMQDEKFYLTDISDGLIKKGLSWKDAHRRVGELLKYAEKRSKLIKQLDKKEIKDILGQEINLSDYFDAGRSLNRKATSCSTNRKYVLREIKRWREVL